MRGGPPTWASSRSTLCALGIRRFVPQLANAPTGALHGSCGTKSIGSKYSVLSLDCAACLARVLIAFKNLKRKTGMGRVRTRGRPRVSLAVFLRCAGKMLFVNGKLWVQLKEKIVVLKSGENQ